MVQQWARLPAGLEWALLVGLALFLAYRRLWLVWVFVLGTLWASVYANWRLADSLASELQGRDVVVQGYIASLPRQMETRASFDFIVTRANAGIPGKLRLNWYYPQTPIKAGQSWQLTLRLKRPHGRSNPGGFDYEAWLFANHIGATGYVRANPEPRLIAAGFSVFRYLAACRQAISDRLDMALPGSGQLGVIKALSIGSQDLISQQQWEVFRVTGIVHLMVISGAHISLVAGLVFLVIRRSWSRFGSLRISPQNMAAFGAGLTAGFYAALAGFSIPVQRALLMVMVGLVAVIWQRNTAVGHILLLALLVVVFFDPLALLSPGFWLSFAAVALLLYVSSGKLGRERYWRQAGKVHLAMALGLSPLLMLFFQQFSLVAPLANALAVPVIGLVVTPLSLLAAGLSFVSPALAALLLWPVDWLLKGLWWLLQHMAAWPMASVFSAQPPGYALAPAVLGVLLILAPRGMPGRHLSVFLWLPLFLVAVEKPKPGEVWFSLLDVGQGLSAVVQTERHVLVFDTGAKYSQDSDMGETVVLPYLRYQGVNRIDDLVISHGDNDHSGGAATLVSQMPVSKIYSSVPQWAEQAYGQYCKAGQSWQWDGVEFRMLSPGPEGFASENDNSCVLKISTASHGFLLTGDIQQSAENWLVERYGSDLASSVLIAPHHGSKTSSSGAFLRQVRPEWVLIPAGYRNRFGFPHATVLKRYDELHIKSFNTAETGAVILKTDRHAMEVALTRQRDRRYWQDTDGHQ